MQLSALRGLCDRCDVLIENFRPGVLRRLKLGYAGLARTNPRLVYCSISGFGSEGPYARKGAFDATIQAMSGIMSVTGYPGQPPAKCGVPIGDFATGLYAAFCIVAAVAHAQRTGRGTFIDCSMLGAMLGIAALQTSEYFGTGRPPQRLGSAHPRAAPYQAFEASDGPFVIAAGNERLWYEVCDAVDLTELKSDPRFNPQAARASNQGQLAGILAPIFRARKKSEWIAEFDRRGVPCAPINDYRDVLADPHVAHTRLVRNLLLPNGRRTKTTSFPVRISGDECAIYRPPPLLGEHNAEVFAEWLADQEAARKPAARRAAADSTTQPSRR